MPRDGEARSGRKGAAKEAAERPADVKPENARTNGAHASGKLMIDLDFLKGLIDAVDDSGIDTVEIVRAGTRVRISKSPPPARIMASAAAAPPAAAPPAPAAELTAPPAPTVEVAPPSKLIDVKSPMVGTFYRAPAPEAPAYVEPGSHVSKGQTLCILEAMKLMNELESEADGVVREVLADNGEPVEFGQVLFRIEPSGS